MKTYLSVITSGGNPETPRGRKYQEMWKKRLEADTAQEKANQRYAKGLTLMFP